MPEVVGYAVFETPIGPCGIAWTDLAIAHVALPGASADATHARMRDAASAPEAAPPPWVEAVVTRIRSHLSGRFDDLADVPIDLNDRPSFHRKVWEEARRIQPGSTRTYGQIALALGTPGAARAVGQALGSNPVPLIVPCHRVLAASGAGGFSAPGGVSTKARLLAIEGALISTVTPRRRAAGPRSATRGG